MPLRPAALAFDIGRRYSIRVAPGGLLLSSLDIAAGRECMADGSEVRFTGYPSGWKLDIARPADRFPRESIVAALKSFATRYDTSAALEYSHLFVHRYFAGDDCETTCKKVAHWALLGHVSGTNGRSVPVGWSGTGDGLGQLNSATLNRRLDWLVSNISCAVPLFPACLPVVLSPQAAAILVHESIGHYSEGAFKSGQDVSHRLGQRVGSELIATFDDPFWRAGATQYDVDDEGVLALGRTEIVRGGVLIAQLHSRASGAAAGTLSTGNGRAALGAEAIPRMSNLVCGVGSSSEEELIDQLGHGLMVHQLAHGFGLGLLVEARVVLAELIVHGRLTGQFLTGGMVRETIDLMVRAVALSNRLETNPNGMCGKAGQILFDVGTVAPSIRMAKLRLTA